MVTLYVRIVYFAFLLLYQIEQEIDVIKDNFYNIIYHSNTIYHNIFVHLQKIIEIDFIEDIILYQSKYITLEFIRTITKLQ